MVRNSVPVILLINGPNLNMLGKRSREHYGSFTLEQVYGAFRTKAEALGVEARFFQSNSEGEIVTAIQEAMGYADGIVINAGAHTHYSYAIMDAIEVCGLPVMEVHISNIHKREPFRNVSVIRQACVGQIYGLGLDSYLVGLEKLCREHVFADSKIAAEQRSGDEGQTGGLSELRSRITEVDAELMRVFNRRMDLAEQIAHLKVSSKSAVYDAARESEVSDLARQRAGEDMATRVDSMMKTMMRISRERQYDILMKTDTDWSIGRELANAGHSLDHVSVVAYAGTRGSYSEAAAKKLFVGKELLPARTFAAACEQLAQKKADVAVLPLENTIVGSVDNVFELLQKNNLYIVRATSIEVAHKLAVIPGTKIEDIRKVTSHPQGLSQCSEAIIRNGWETIVSDNTAFSAQDVAERGDFSLAAISSEEAARESGLEILTTDICNADRNRTRFIVVSADLIITPDADRISTLMHLPHRSGALVSALQVFADRGLNLSAISSRPIAGTPGEYAFFLDFICPSMGQEALLALYQLSFEMPYVKVLGWYVEE
ncbi:MAG: type II 3-dehydroquinate dehydratase [Clostridiaceae bacterium]|jgi:chorismate mutase/prephenate dehydratase|nr:type II 3-dehydroquinate dehydratase [Clostridiaceae bacterium]